jgi:hypothetical protein
MHVSAQWAKNSIDQHTNDNNNNITKCTTVKHKVLINAAIHSENVQVIRCDIKQGSLERSIHD